MNESEILLKEKIDILELDLKESWDTIRSLEQTIQFERAENNTLRATIGYLQEQADILDELTWGLQDVVSDMFDELEQYDE